MKKTNGNYIKVSLYRAKIYSEININSYTLKLDFGKNSIETDKITSRDVDLGGKSYFFEFQKNHKALEFTITANSKTLFIFDTTLAKITIPFSNIDNKEWYYLKNEKDENVIAVLTSIYIENSAKSNSVCDNDNMIFSNLNGNNSYLTHNNKNDISCDVVRTNTSNRFISIINKNNVTYNGVNNINSILNNNSVDDIYIKDSKDTRKTNLDLTMVLHDKSPDVSSITNKLFSPYSYRVENNDGNLNINSSKLNFDNLDLSIENKLFDETNANTLTKEDVSDLFNKIKRKFKLLNEERERTNKFKDDIVKNKDKIKQKEAILQKEKQKLENHIKNFKNNKTDHESKNLLLSQQAVKFNYEVNKFNIEKEIFNFEKDNFYKINFMLNSSKLFTNSLNNMCVVNYNTNSNNSTFSTLHNSLSCSDKKIKKEIVLEKVVNNSSDNRLLDSLDNYSILTPINKKTNSKFKRSGSDDKNKKFTIEKTEEKKKPSVKAVNTTNILGISKDKKLQYNKQTSSEKSLNSNKKVEINIGNNKLKINKVKK